MHPAINQRMIGRLVLGFLLDCGVALAVEKADLKIGKTVQLPDVGLTFKIMPKSQEQPLPAPEVRTMFFIELNPRAEPGRARTTIEK